MHGICTPIIHTQYNKEIRNLRSQDIRTIDLEIGSSSFRGVLKLSQLINV